MAQRVVVHADQHDLDRHRTNPGAVSWRQAHPANAFLWDGGRGGDHSALLPSMALSGLGASGCHVGFGPGNKPHDDDVLPVSRFATLFRLHTGQSIGRGATTGSLGARAGAFPMVRVDTENQRTKSGLSITDAMRNESGRARVLICSGSRTTTDMPEECWYFSSSSTCCHVTAGYPVQSTTRKLNLIHL